MSEKNHSLVFLAHDVKTPLSQHHSGEFRNRVKYFENKFQSIHLISVDKKDCITSSDSTNDFNSNSIRFTRLGNGIIANSFHAYRIMKPSIAIFADTQMDLLWLLPAIILARKKVILFQQGYDLKLSELYLKARIANPCFIALFRIIYYFLNLISYALCSAVLCVNQGLAIHVRSHLSSRRKTAVYVVPQAIPPEAYVPCSSSRSTIRNQLSIDIEKKDYLCFVGRFDLLKRGDIALKAFSHLTRRKNVWLLMIGDGFRKKELMHLANTLSVYDRVIFTGWIPKQDVLCYLSKSKALIFPSLSEGSSNTVYEALLVGCPVIAHRYHGIESEGLDKILLLHDSLDPRDYANSIERILTDEELGSELAKKGKNLALRNLFQSSGERYEYIVSLIEKHMQ